MCWGVMDTAVACPLKNNLHPFAWELIRGGEGRFDSTAEQFGVVNIKVF